MSEPVKPLNKTELSKLKRSLRANRLPWPEIIRKYLECESDPGIVKKLAEEYNFAPNTFYLNRRKLIENLDREAKKEARAAAAAAAK